MSFKSLKQLSEETAARARQIRLEEKWTQKELSERAGIPLSTYKRFEQKGLISFEGLIKVAIALRAEDGLEALFAPKANTSEFTSLEELEQSLKRSQKKLSPSPPKA